MAAQSVSGFLVIDKPAGMTSRAAVDHVQRWFMREKMGHAGTLDPAATGVLVIGIGMPATRLVEYIQQQNKTYEATFILGAVSTTDDAEGAITQHRVLIAPPEAKIREKIGKFIGNIEQTPPAFSAALVSGKRAHELAREGVHVPLTPRPVMVYRFVVKKYAYPQLDVEIECGKGTYIRALARDLGKALGIGGYVKSLRRTHIGPFQLEQAIAWDADAATAHARLLPLTLAVSHLPQLPIDDEQWRRIGMGQPISFTCETHVPAGLVAIVNSHDVLIGIGNHDLAHTRLSPEKVFKSLPATGSAEPSSTK